MAAALPPFRRARELIQQGAVVPIVMVTLFWSNAGGSLIFNPHAQAIVAY